MNEIRDGYALPSAELLNMEVIDHLVITKESFYSFTLTGTLSKLEKSKKYAVYFIEEEKLLKKGKKEGLEEGVAIGEIKGKKEREIEIARKMLFKGVKVADIADFTGLSKVQITKLSKTKKKK